MASIRTMLAGGCHRIVIAMAPSPAAGGMLLGQKVKSARALNAHAAEGVDQAPLAPRTGRDPTTSDQDQGIARDHRLGKPIYFKVGATPCSTTCSSPCTPAPISRGRRLQAAPRRRKPCHRAQGIPTLAALRRRGRTDDLTSRHRSLVISVGIRSGADVAKGSPWAPMRGDRQGCWWPWAATAIRTCRRASMFGARGRFAARHGSRLLSSLSHRNARSRGRLRIPARIAPDPAWRQALKNYLRP